MLTNTEIVNILDALSAPSGLFVNGHWYSFVETKQPVGNDVQITDILLAIQAGDGLYLNSTWSSVTVGSAVTTPTVPTTTTTTTETEVPVDNGTVIGEGTTPTVPVSVPIPDNEKGVN